MSIKRNAVIPNVRSSVNNPTLRSKSAPAPKAIAPTESKRNNKSPRKHNISTAPPNRRNNFVYFESEHFGDGIFRLNGR
jgi:hypothetical protein